MEKRNYQGVVDRVQTARQGTREILGWINGYPVLAVHLVRDPSRPTALLMGGTHGDEPAGVEAALAFLQRDLEPWLAKLNFQVIPCLNPHGYVHDTRHNGQDVDINWAYQRDDVPEIYLFRRLVAGRRFAFFLDFHEDWESPGFYLYEIRRNHPPLGAQITARVARVCPLNTQSTIEGAAAENGVILPDAQKVGELSGAGIPVVMYETHTDHILTSESPTALDVATRVQAHMVTLETVVEAHLSS